MLSRKRCDCSGYRPIAGSLGDASFARPTDEPMPSLRIARIPSD
jgi:hypothetical protein